MRTALSLATSDIYPTALPVMPALASLLTARSTRVTWSRATHAWCSDDVRIAVRSRGLMLGARGMPVLCDDVWRYVIFPFLIEGEGPRREVDRSACACCGKTGVPSKNRCARCKRVRYCDRECQKWDWKVGGHKAECGSEGVKK